MQINVSGHHVEVTDSLHSHVVEKMRRLERHFDKAIDINVILTVEKKDQRAEANLTCKGNTINAHSAHEDMYHAIDDMVTKLDRQVIKHKEKLTDHRH